MAEASRFHSIKVDREKCIGCVTCMKACPTKAIRVEKDKKAFIIYERCVDCGECLRVCPHEAVIPIITTTADLERFVAMLKDTEAAIAALIADGKSLEEVLDAKPTAKWDDIYGDPSAIVDRAFDSLSRHPQ